MGGVPDRPGSSSTGSGSGRVACDLNFQVQLFGPVPKIVATLSVGDALSVAINREGAAPVVAVSTLDSVPERAGTLTPDGDVPDLIDCMSKGYVYKATVTSINGSEIWLRVERDRTA